MLAGVDASGELPPPPPADFASAAGVQELPPSLVGAAGAPSEASLLATQVFDALVVAMNDLSRAEACARCLLETTASLRLSNDTRAALVALVVAAGGPGGAALGQTEHSSARGANP